MQMLEFIEELAKKICEIERCVSNLSWLNVAGRDDNLLCLALVLENAVIVKTVMHRWELMS